MGTHHPAATQFACLPVPVFFLEAQATQHLFGLGLDARIVQHIELGLRFKVLRIIGGAGRFVLAQNGFQLIQIARFAGGHIQRCHGAGDLALLRQVAEGGVLIALNGAGIWRVLAQQQREQGGLARPIGADQRHALAVVDGHVRVLKQDAGIEGLGEFAKDQHGGVSINGTGPSVQGTEDLKTKDRRPGGTATVEGNPRCGALLLPDQKSSARSDSSPRRPTVALARSTKKSSGLHHCSFQNLTGWAVRPPQERRRWPRH